MAQNSKSDLPVKKNAFVHKLYDMLNNKLISHLIWWADTAEANTFLLCPNKEFAEALSSYFKHENVASFVRQLHMYGFHKVSDPTPSGDKGTAIWEFRHSLGKFRKDDEASLVFIKRRLQLNSQTHTETAPLPGHHYEMSQYYYKPQYVQFVPNMPMYGAPGIAQNHPAFQSNIHDPQVLAHNQAMAHNMAIPQNHQLLAQNVHHSSGQPGQPPPGFAYYPVPITQQATGSHLPIMSQQVPPGFQQGHAPIVFPPYSGATEVNEGAGFSYHLGAPHAHGLPQIAASQAPAVPPQYQPVFQGHWQGPGGNLHHTGENSTMAERPILLGSGTGVLAAGSSLPSAANSGIKPELADVLPLAKPLSVKEPVDQKSGESSSQNTTDATVNTNVENRHNPSVSLRPSWSERHSQSLVECLTPVIGLMNQVKDGKPLDQWQPKPLEIVQGLPKDGLKADSPRGSYRPFPLPSISESMYYNTPTLLPAQFSAQSAFQLATQPVTQSTTQSTTQNSTPHITAAPVLDGSNTRRLYNLGHSSEPSSAISSAFPPDCSIPKLPVLDVLKANGNVAATTVENPDNVANKDEPSEEKKTLSASHVSASVPATPMPAARPAPGPGFASHLLNDSPPKDVSQKADTMKTGENNVTANVNSVEDPQKIAKSETTENNCTKEEKHSVQSSPTFTNGKDLNKGGEKRNSESSEKNVDSVKSGRGASKLEHLLDDDDENRKVKRREL